MSTIVTAPEAVSLLLGRIHEALLPRLSPYAVCESSPAHLRVVDVTRGERREVEMVPDGQGIHVLMDRPSATCTHRIAGKVIAAASLDADILAAEADSWGQVVATWLAQGADPA